MSHAVRDIEASGGCQCGAVRFHATSMLDNSHLCHCRMCQKAAGSIFAGLVAAPNHAIAWTRGKPAIYRSSEHVARGFCENCGTPLFYKDLQGQHTNFMIGSLDHPQDFPPAVNSGSESMVPWFGAISSLQKDGPTETHDPAWAQAIKVSNNQHPDHDTAEWAAKSKE